MTVKEKVIDGMIIRLTFDGGFQRSRIYRSNVSDVKRREFRKYLALELPKILMSIRKSKRYCDDNHCKMIEKFSSNITEKFSRILHRKKFRIGNAQKFLNLYWKVAWILKKTSSRPIHCPFDSIVMKKLPRNVRVAWTKFDTINEYKLLVEAARKAAGAMNIADWEMELYWKTLNAES